jgi:hypothetical protein
MTLHVYQDTTKTDWVIAYSIDDASRVWSEHYGEDLSDYPDLKWTLVRWDTTITVRSDIGCDLELKASDWINRNGRGFLASTEY